MTTRSFMGSSAVSIASSILANGGQRRRETLPEGIPEEDLAGRGHGDEEGGRGCRAATPGRQGANLADEPAAAPARHLQVTHEHMWTLALHRFERLGGRGHSRRGRSVVFEHRDHCGADVLTVVNHEDSYTTQEQPVMRRVAKHRCYPLRLCADAPLRAWCTASTTSATPYGSPKMTSITPDAPTAASSAALSIVVRIQVLFFRPAFCFRSRRKFQCFSKGRGRSYTITCGS